MMRKWLFLLPIISLSFAACGGNKSSSPAQAVRSYMEAIEAFDVAKAKTLVCAPQRAQVENSLTAFGDTSKLGETFAMSLEDMQYEEQSNDGSIAVVSVKGQMKLSFLGQEEIQEINEKHTVIQQGGRWLVCDP